MNKKNSQISGWSIRPIGNMKSVDVSAVIYKQERKENPYIRSASYRNRKPAISTGSNSEIY